MSYRMTPHHYRLGDLLVEKKHISHEQLTEALNIQRQSPGKALGEILVEQKFISALQLKYALTYQGWLKKIACAVAISTSLAAFSTGALAGPRVAKTAGKVESSQSMGERADTASHLDQINAPPQFSDELNQVDYDGLITIAPLNESGTSQPLEDKDEELAPPDLSVETEIEEHQTQDSVVISTRVILSWDTPGDGDDSSAANSVQKYEIYFLNESTGDMDIITVSGSNNKWSANLAKGEYSFAIKAIDVNGQSTELSSLVGTVVT
ncbi:MAG: hypothetical protein HRU20_21135 [Pseudomonadales bacterium]|nr:hypothetical protein [Pseudomonadales bacterium]